MRPGKERNRKKAIYRLVPVVNLVEENCNSIASALIQQKNLERFLLLEKKEDEIKVFMKGILDHPEWSNERIRHEVRNCYASLLRIDREQDRIITSLTSLAGYIGKINYESNGILKKYDVTGNYRQKNKSGEVPSKVRNQMLIGEEVYTCAENKKIASLCRAEQL